MLYLSAKAKTNFLEKLFQKFKRLLKYCYERINSFFAIVISVGIPWRSGSGLTGAVCGTRPPGSAWRSTTRGTASSWRPAPSRTSGSTGASRIIKQNLHRTYTANLLILCFTIFLKIHSVQIYVYVKEMLFRQTKKRYPALKLNLWKYTYW